MARTSAGGGASRFPFFDVLRKVLRVGKPRGKQQRKRRRPRGPITLKSRREIELMRAACGLVVEAHRTVRRLIEPGITTGELDSAVAALYRQHDAEPLFLGVPCPAEGGPPFPAVTCISVNEEVVHGIPGRRKLVEGDIVSVDTGARLHGWCGDAAWTYPVGEVSPDRKAILEAGEAVLMLAIKEFGRRSRWSEVAHEMEAFAVLNGYGVVRDFVGHAIGREMHEDPQVPNFVGDDMAEQDFALQPGLVLAIEPMLNGGVDEVEVLGDGWTVVTEDGEPSVHFEHTVALTAEGPVILTAGVGEK
jgi:methionyl aminopeptidase